MDKKVTVVIPTYNRVKSLEKLIKSLEAQTMDKELFEVIVVDDGSTDRTLEFLKCKSKEAGINLRYFYQKNLGPATARNLAIEKTNAPLIAFTDDDCILDANWLRALLEALPNDEKCAGVGGKTIGTENRLISKHIDSIGAFDHISEGGKVLYLVTNNALYRRECLKEVGGFCTDFSWAGGEDPELSYRLRNKGYYFTKTNDAVIKHIHGNSIRDFYDMYYRYGRGSILLTRHEYNPIFQYFETQPMKLFFGGLIEHLSKTKGYSLRLRLISWLFSKIQNIAFYRGAQYQLNKSVSKNSNDKSS